MHLSPFIGLVAGSVAPLVEGLVVLGWVETVLPHGPLSFILEKLLDTVHVWEFMSVMTVDIA